MALPSKHGFAIETIMRWPCMMPSLLLLLKAECPVVAHQQGAADLCAAYGLASAVHEYGDTMAGGVPQCVSMSAVHAACGASRERLGSGGSFA